MAERRPPRSPSRWDRTAGRTLGRAHVGVVVIDASQEGWRHSPERTRLLHGFAERLDVPIQQCVYLTQDRTYGVDYRGVGDAIDGSPL